MWNIVLHYEGLKNNKDEWKLGFKYNINIGCKRGLKNNTIVGVYFIKNRGGGKKGYNG